ncbi:MAG: proton-conducting transporter membrane subunit, partial [Pseudomonadales bacterium]
PLTMAALVIGGLSLIGVPMTAGFISKWYFVSAALEQGWWTLAMAILLGSLLAAVYVWRLVEAGYFRESEHGKLEVSEAPLTLLAPMWILVIANIYFGLDTRLPISVSEFTAASLMEKLAGPAP